MVQLTEDAVGARALSVDVEVGNEKYSRTSLTSMSSKFSRSISSVVAIAPSCDIVSTPTIWAAGSCDVEAAGHSKSESSKLITHSHLKVQKSRDESLPTVFNYTSDKPPHQFEAHFQAQHEEAGVLHGHGHAEIEKCGSAVARVESRKRKPNSVGNTASFKFVAPVQKKAKRAKLQATEYTLCTPFYSVVMVGDVEAMLGCCCNHVDNSWHRFLDVPLSTPEGFWNIGFDTEIPQ